MVVYVGLMAALIIIQRLTELTIAERNRRFVTKAGAIEFGAKHYPLFFVLHAGWLGGWIAEAYYRGTASDFWHLWLAVYILVQGLRYWCIVSLGKFWNTRILVIPGAQLICRGPYRYVSHPNYIAVVLEIGCVPLLFGAVTTAAIASLVNVLLLAVRIPEEERALQLLQNAGNKK